MFNNLQMVNHVRLLVYGHGNILWNKDGSYYNKQLQKKLRKDRQEF